MHTEKREDPLPDMGYEVRDINLKAIGTATIWFFGFAGISAVIGAVLFFYMNPGMHKEPANAMVRQPLDQNVPLVQGNIHAKTDVSYLRQHEEEALYGAPKLNEDGKTYTIPIEAAMKMVAATPQGKSAPGWPSAQQHTASPETASATDPTVDAGTQPTGGMATPDTAKPSTNLESGLSLGHGTAPANTTGGH